MQDLDVQAGQFRMTEVGIMKGNQVAHMAPPAKRVPELIESLFRFLCEDDSISWTIKSCIFHYEFEFIHPFEDGNGRMGRLWQQLVLMKDHPIYSFLAIEEVIKENQKTYYDVLGQSDQQGESTVFIEFMLMVILTSLKQYSQSATTSIRDWTTRLEYMSSQWTQKEFARKEYMQMHPEISQATASRDLLHGLENGVLSAIGTHNQKRYFFMKGKP